MLGDLKFLESLKEYDKDNIPAQIMAKIRAKYIPNPDFVPEVIQKVSSACEGLCKWVRAIDVYDSVAKVVAPKKQSLDAAEAILAEQMAKLTEKRAELKSVTDKLQSLEENLIRKQEEKKVHYNFTKWCDFCAKQLLRTTWAFAHSDQSGPYLFSR